MKLYQLFGLTGTLVVAAAYVPQIRHLIKEHCSAGISVRAYSLWFLASLLFLVHAFMIKDVVFVFVQVLNLAAICAIVIYCKRYANEMCLMHLKKFKQAETPKIE
ncbi:MAG TPA: PQ-loop repeat-containing protein [Candidatus Acidoferrum sp.]|nr:PQ-loop repeat-containing protein [Candidatus Acidoferrum sp.]